MTAIRTFSAHIISASAALALSFVLISNTVAVPQVSAPAASMEYVA